VEVCSELLSLQNCFKTIRCFFIIIFWSGTVVWTQGFDLARQVLYHLRHAPSPFCFSYFSDRVSYFLPRADLRLKSSYTGLPLSWNHKYTPPCSASWLRWGLANFFPDWPWLSIFLIFTSWVAKDYRYKPLHPVLVFPFIIPCARPEIAFHACNPSYSGGRNWEDRGLRSARTKS
jgi:hypothetical protein